MNVAERSGRRQLTLEMPRRRYPVCSVSGFGFRKSAGPVALAWRPVGRRVPISNVESRCRRRGPPRPTTESRTRRWASGRPCSEPADRRSSRGAGRFYGGSGMRQVAPTWSGRVWRERRLESVGACTRVRLATAARARRSRRRRCLRTAGEACAISRRWVAASGAVLRRRGRPAPKNGAITPRHGASEYRNRRVSHVLQQVHNLNYRQLPVQTGFQ